jgi:hypothetical protein
MTWARSGWVRRGWVRRAIVGARTIVCLDLITRANPWAVALEFGPETIEGGDLVVRSSPFDALLSMRSDPFDRDLETRTAPKVLAFVFEKDPTK